MDREEMIRLLVVDRLEHRDDLGRYLHLQRILENGFRGFRHMSDADLAREIDRLGLLCGGDGGDAESGFSGDAEFEDADPDGGLDLGVVAEKRNSFSTAEW